MELSSRVVPVTTALGHAQATARFVYPKAGGVAEVNLFD